VWTVKPLLMVHELSIRRMWVVCKMLRYEQELCHFGGTVSMDIGLGLIGSGMRCME